MKIVNTSQSGTVVEINGRYVRLSPDLHHFAEAYLASDGEPACYRALLARDGTEPDWHEADRFATQIWPNIIAELDTPKRSVLHLKITLLGERAVCALSRILASLFSVPAATVVLLALLACGFAYRPDGNATLGLWLTVPLVLLSAIFHELGHAAALAKGGGKPGRIGFGFYYILPSFFADVTAAWSLDRKRRLLVDTGGIWLQSIFLIAANGVLNAMLGIDMTIANVLIVTLMLKTLNPVFKFDGYWMLSDLFDVPNLHQRVFDRVKAREFGGADGKLVALYATLVVAFYGYVMAVLATASRRLVNELQTIGPNADLAHVSAKTGLLMLTLVFFCWIGISSLQKARALWR